MKKKKNPIQKPYNYSIFDDFLKTTRGGNYFINFESVTHIEGENPFDREMSFDVSFRICRTTRENK